MQNKFAFFANFAETIRCLPEDKQADAYKAICEFGIYGTLPDDVLLKSLCLMAQNSIYKNVGGAPEGNKNAQKKQPKTTPNNLETTSKQPMFQETETRNKKQETETETESVATSRSDKYAFEGKVIKLTKSDFDSWSSAFPDLNLRAELLMRDQWLAQQPDDIRKRWFISTQQYFLKQNEFRKKQNQDDFQVKLEQEEKCWF